MSDNVCVVITVGLIKLWCIITLNTQRKLETFNFMALEINVFIYCFVFVFTWSDFRRCWTSCHLLATYSILNPPLPPPIKHTAFQVEVVVYYYSCIDTNIHRAQHSTLMWTDTSNGWAAVFTAFDAVFVCTCKNKTLIVQYKQEITYRPCLISLLAQLQ
jgi:hypothetical protein